MRNDFCSDYFEHSLFKRGAKKGSTWKNHKYVNRVQVGSTYRYFYTLQEWLAYIGKTLNDKKDKLLQDAKDAIQKGERAISKALDTKKNQEIKKELTTESLREEKIQKTQVEKIDEINKKRVNDLSNLLVEEKKYVHENIKKDNIKKAEQKKKIENAKKSFCKDSVDSHKEKYEEHTNLKLKDKETTKAQDQQACNPNYKYTKEAYYKLKAQYDAASLEEKKKLKPALEKAYSDWKGWSQNCADCMLTYDLRRRGYDVTAARQTNGEGWTTEEILSCYKGDLESEKKWANASKTTKRKNWLGLEVEEYKNKNGYRYPAFDNNEINQIKSEMLSEYPEGSYGYLNVNWQSGGSHACIWSIEDGEVVIRDTQTNETYELDDYLEKACSYQRVRLDDKELSDKAYEYAEAEVLKGDKIIKKKG